MRLLAFLIILLPALPLAAQQKAWSLDECMEYAVQNSTSAKKQQYANDNYRQDHMQNVASMLPSIGASTNAGWGFGRGLDPATNTYGTTANFNNNYSVSASLPLFNGFAAVNSLRASKIAMLRGTQQAQKVADDMAMAAMKAYFDALYYKGMVELAREQLAESSANLAKTSKMAELGLKASADVAQVEAQVAENDYNLTRQQNLLEGAILTLKDCMNYPFADSLSITDETGRGFYSGSTSADEIYGYARENLPQSLIADYSLRESELGFKAARGRQFPYISASAGYSTNYFRNLTSGGDTNMFRNQFRDNAGESVGISMSIPIFNGLSRRASINRSRNSMNIARQEQTEAQRQLQNEIAQAVLDVEGLSKEYVQSVKSSGAYGQAHQANLRRFEQGTISALDLQTSANQLLGSRAQELYIKLNYLMRSRLVEFYQGRPLIDK